MSDSIKENVLKIREKISVSAEKSGRRESEIQLVAVSKLQPVENINVYIVCAVMLYNEIT